MLTLNNLEYALRIMDTQATMNYLPASLLLCSADASKDNLVTHDRKCIQGG